MNRLVTWVTKMGGMLGGPRDGFIAGPVLATGPNAVYVTTQGKPWYAVQGPGVMVQNQMTISQPAQAMTQKTLQNFSVLGAGVAAGTYGLQGLTVPGLYELGNGQLTTTAPGN